MKVKKIIASLFLIFPTLLYFEIGFVALLFHSNFYIFIPIILIGINISLYKYNRIITILGSIFLVLLISWSVYQAAYTILVGGYSFAGYSQILMARLDFISTICLLYPLNLMVGMITRSRQEQP
jgi:hypothetical protein